MEKIIEFLARMNDIDENIFPTAYRPRLIIKPNGDITLGWHDIANKREVLYPASCGILGNIRDLDAVYTNLENWALEVYEKKNK